MEKMTSHSTFSSHSLAHASHYGNKMGCEEFHVDFKTLVLNLFFSNTIFNANTSQDIFSIKCDKAACYQTKWEYL